MHARIQRPAWAVVAAVAVFVMAVFVMAVATPAALASRPAPTAPTAPSGLQGTATSDNDIALTWTASTDKAGSFTYTVQVLLPGGQTADYTGIKATSFTYTQGSPDEAYTFTVFAVGANGATSSPSNSVTVTTQPQPAPPTPTISVIATTPATVSVGVSGSTGGELVEFGIEMNGSYVPGSQLVFGVPPGDSIPAGETAYTVIGLTPGSTNTFTGEAESDFGSTSFSSPISVTTPTTTDTTAPSTPTDLTYSLPGCNQVQLDWNASSDPSYPESALLYEVFVDGVHATTFDDVYGTTTTDVFPNPGSTITVSIEAVDPAGLASPASNVVTVTNVPSC